MVQPQAHSVADPVDGGADTEFETPWAAQPERRVAAVSAALHGQRLDKAVVAMAPEFSRTHLQGLIEHGHVSVDGTILRTPSRKVLAGQAIGVDLVPTAESRAFRMVVHPAAGNWSGTLLNALLAHHRASASLARAGIVHRLDKDTSGLMVVGKTLPALTALSRAIAAREVHREYLALAHGEVRPAAFSIDAPIARDPQSRVRMATYVKTPNMMRRCAGPCRRRWHQRAALHVAHGAHPPDPGSPGGTRSPAGGRRRVRRRARAGDNASGLARDAPRIRPPGVGPAGVVRCAATGRSGVCLAQRCGLTRRIALVAAVEVVTMRPILPNADPRGQHLAVHPANDEAHREVSCAPKVPRTGATREALPTCLPRNPLPTPNEPGAQREQSPAPALNVCRVRAGSTRPRM